jgi:hypothetical protein
MNGTISTSTEKPGESTVTLIPVWGETTTLLSGANTSLPPCSGTQAIESELVKLELILGGVMKRILIVNDISGNKVMREVILDEINKAIRYTREAEKRVRGSAAEIVGAV